ncbi:MAG: flagellar export protein FliJ [Oleiphilus sp.]|nr:MAG: flagellar export protein FliJ [Oleiphilus sp.]
MPMPKKSERLRLVFELAERKEQTAKEQLSKAKAYLDQQLQQQNMLASYRVQYLADLKARMSGVASVAQLVSNQNFIRQLDQAIEQQTAVVENARSGFERFRAEWQALHEKSKGMSDLLARTLKEEQLAREKRLEKQIEDDFLTRRRFQ